MAAIHQLCIVLMCSCLRSRLTSLDVFNFAHYIAKIKRLSRVFLRVFPVKPRNTYVAVYFFALNKAQRARANERNMNTHTTLTCKIHTICALLRVKTPVFARNKAHISDCD